MKDESRHKKGRLALLALALILPSSFILHPFQFQGEGFSNCSIYAIEYRPDESIGFVKSDDFANLAEHPTLPVCAVA